VFVGDVPQVVQQTVDIAIEAGCEGVIAQRDLWAARAIDPAMGDEASVYAHHAQNVANYIGCVSPPLPTVSPG
jgi:tagatose-1,6-bisphosphate aldolase